MDNSLQVHKDEQEIYAINDDRCELLSMSALTLELWRTNSLRSSSLPGYCGEYVKQQIRVEPRRNGQARSLDDKDTEALVHEWLTCSDQNWSKGR